MKELNKSFLECKKSKFYGYNYNVNSVEEINLIINELKTEHKKAKHVVYAYKVGNSEKKYEDKEPSGSAGTPILNLIKIKKLDNILIVVVRYFGGTLLGKGILTRSYANTANKLFEYKK